MQKVLGFDSKEHVLTIANYLYSLRYFIWLNNNLILVL